MTWSAFAVLTQEVDDGTCFVQPLQNRVTILGRASMHQVADAAREIVERCMYFKSPKRGGVAFEIGQ